MTYPTLATSSYHISLIAIESILIFGLFSLLDLGVIKVEKLKVGEELTLKSYRKAWSLVLKNEALMIVTASIIGYDMSLLKEEDFLLEAPTFFQWLWQTLLLVMAVDFGVYWGHRIFHYGRFYTWIHKVHHRYHDIISLHSLCTHIVELYSVMFLVFMIPKIFNLLVDIHPLTIYITTFLLTAHNIISHSGYDDHLEDITFGLISGSKMHMVHHQKSGYNFGFYTYLWDYVFGTKMSYEEMIKEAK